jgi:hypothetical protein
MGTNELQGVDLVVSYSEQTKGKLCVLKGVEVIVNEGDVDEWKERLFEDTLEGEAREEVSHPKVFLENIDEMVRLVAGQFRKQGEVLLRRVVLLWEEAFYKEGDKIPTTHLIKHYIHLKDEDDVVFARQPLIPMAQREYLLEKIASLEKKGVLQKAEGSPFNSPVMLVAKKLANQFRMVNSFVRLNAVTKALSAFPMMRIDDCLMAVQGMQCFATLDFSDGYYQVEIHQPHRERTAFYVQGYGQWQYVKMSQGLAGSPATFNRLINMVLGKVRELWLVVGDKRELLSVCVQFVDDILLASKSVDAHLYHLEMILREVARANLVLNPKKCKVLQSKVEFCGRMLDREGLLPTDEDIRRLVRWPRPMTRKLMYSFLGLLNFISEFLEKEKELSAPLRQLKVDKWRRLIWTEEATQALRELRMAMQDKGKMRLAIPIFGKPECRFILNTDASKYAVCAVLRQDQPDGARRVVSFSSRTMTAAELKYSMPAKEALAVVFGLQRFEVTIKGQPLKLECDHAALVACFKRGDSHDRMMSRWLIIIQSFMPMDMEYVEGVSNVADIMTRNPALNPE